MQDFATWQANLSAATVQLFNATVAYLPNLFGALALLVAGWLVARLVRAGTLKFGDGVNRLLERYLRVGRLTPFRLSPPAVALIANVASWLIILVFVTAATRVARLDAVASWLDRIVAYMPTLLAGALIILVGYLVSAMVRDVVAAGVASAGFGQSEYIGIAAQAATFLTAAVIGIGQIGIDVTFLMTIIAVVIAAALTGLTLAFGLGARTYVSNLIGAHDLRRHLRPGQTARIGAVEGEIVELTPTSVVLATAEGRSTIPAKVFHEQMTVLVAPAGDDE